MIVLKTRRNVSRNAWCHALFLILSTMVIFPTLSSYLSKTFIESTKAGNDDPYMLWIAKHQANVSRFLTVYLDSKLEKLIATIDWKVLESYIGEILNLSFTYLNYSVDVSSLSINEIVEILEKLGLSRDEANRVLRGETVTKDLGTSIELITMENDPPFWCDWGYPAPKWAYSRKEIKPCITCPPTKILYVAEDPINIIFKIYPPKSYNEFTFILEELRDSNDVNDRGTNDNWPVSRVGYSYYLYDCYLNAWREQDESWAEGGKITIEEIGFEIMESDTLERMHIRLWKVRSPSYGYIIVASVHLEDEGVPHELLHIGINYWYAYEYAEKYFTREFRQNYQGPWWVSWNASNSTSPLVITSSKEKAEKHGDIVSDFYVYLDFAFSSYGGVFHDYIYLGNGVLYKCYYWYEPDKGREGYSCDYSKVIKSTGNGYASYIYYQSPSRPR